MPRVLQACGPCKRRKVRCNGEQACQQCTHLGLKCWYSEIDPASRSRRNIGRGTVIDEHRRKPGFAPRDIALRSSPKLLDSPSSTASDTGCPRSVETAFFASLVNDYTYHVFPFLPIIEGAHFESLVLRSEYKGDDGALVHALAAVTINMTRARSQHHSKEADQIQKLCTKALELRTTAMPDSSITVENIMIPLLVSICLFAKRSNINMGFYFLREAVTRLQILQEVGIAAQGALNSKDMAQIERLHGLLFVHERFVAVTYNRYVVLSPANTISTLNAPMKDLVIEGFNHIIRLFSVIDAAFVMHWLDRQSISLTLGWIDGKQLEIGRDMDEWEEEIQELTEVQQVDLIVTRYWLHTLLWQMALSKFLLTSNTEKDNAFMSIMFPVRISRRLRSILAVMQPEAVEIHGTGIVQKIFEITNTIADIIINVLVNKTAGNTSEDPLDDFLFLYRFLLRMSKFHHVEEAVLNAKLQQIQTDVPNMG